jgi:hypothetical protein
LIVLDSGTIRRIPAARSGDVAQLGERRLCKPEVVGSSPIVSIAKVLFNSFRVNNGHVGAK